MSKRHSEEHEEEMGEGWLLPYADLLTLLLALFIVLFASSQVDQQKFNAIAAAFAENIMGGVAIETIGDYPDLSMNPPSDEVLENIEGLIKDGVPSKEMVAMANTQKQIEEIFAENQISSEVSIKTDERGLVISLSNAMLFDSGKAAVKEQYRSMLVFIANSINQLDNYVRVEGHTDIVPLSNTSIYPSNWELSTARACSVVRIFIDEGKTPAEKLVACGYGETRPIADNTTAEGRAENRRIDIILLNSKYNTLEVQQPTAAPEKSTKIMSED